VEIVLLIGAAPYRLDERGARWLEETIRERFRVDDGRPVGLSELDEAARACIRLADVLAEDLASGSSPEPIELGRWQVEGLLAYVLRDYLVQSDEELAALYVALRRYRGDPV
jgi:hypothetical protein